MIKFSWKTINDKLNWNMVAVVSYFYLVRGLKPQNMLVPLAAKNYSKLPIPAGDCYIINIDEFLKKEAARSSTYDIYLYLELASKRSLFDYKMRGIKWLPEEVVVEHNIADEVRESTLLWLDINTRTIHFKYEETGE